MRVLYLILSLSISLILIWVVTTVAADITVDETDLLPSPSKVYELNLGSDGYLYLSDNSGEGNLLRLNPSTGVYSSYEINSPVRDAKLDSSGNVWWVDGAESFNRLELATNNLTTWDIPARLGGLDFDDQNRIWMVDWEGTFSRLYRFNPSTLELCTYTISSANSSSHYIIYADGKIWLANRDIQRIYLVDPEGGRVKYWNITNISARPHGLALDGDGNLWWADSGLGALGHLEPGSNLLSFYSLPANTGSEPKMVTLRPEGIWYTENLSGTVGLLDPSSAAGDTNSVTTGINTLTSACETLSSSPPVPLSPSEGTFTWESYPLSSIVDSDGWLVYQLPTDPGDVKPKAYGLAYTNGYLWVGDHGRQKLVRMSPDISGISIQKHTEGEDADTPTGPILRVGDTVNWEYIVTNGATPLSNVTVTDDDPSVIVSCPKTSLVAEEIMTCTASGIVDVGQYSNTATVSGDNGKGTVDDSDPSHYFGADPILDLEKSTNGQDADTPPGSTIQVGGIVNWVYTIQNNGDVPLTAIVVSDDDSSIQINCPHDNLSVAHSMDCTATGIAKPGQYQNQGSVIGYFGGLSASAQDYSHYFGEGDQYYLPVVVK